MITLAVLASIYSSNCLAYARSGDVIERCDGKLLRLDHIAVADKEDSPECLEPPPGPNRWCDTALADAAREELRRFLAGETPAVWYSGEEDGKGSFLVSVTVDGVDAGRHLIRKGVARRANDANR